MNIQWLCDVQLSLKVYKVYEFHGAEYLLRSK